MRIKEIENCTLRLITKMLLLPAITPIRNMKNIFILLFTAINISCVHNSLPKRLIPDEYYFPEKMIGFGTKMVYVNRNTSDTTYCRLFHRKVHGRSYLIQCNSDKKSVSDSIVFLNRELVDYYINPDNDGQLWKADQISDTVLANKDEKLNEIAEFHWLKGKRYASVKSQTEIIKDTVLQWRGKLYSTIITKSIIETNSNFLKTPNGENNFKMEITSYISKNIGPVRQVMTCGWIPKAIITDLIEIGDVQN